MKIPASLRQGDTAYWLDDPYTDGAGKTYASDVYALAYIIAGPITNPVSLTAAANGGGWRTTLDATAAGNLVAGKYWWEAVITGNGERVTIASGELAITVNLANAGANYDGRSLAEKALADAETALAQYKVSGGKIKSYTIGSRTMTFEDGSAILAQISYWKIKVRAEQGKPRNLLARFK